MKNREQWKPSKYQFHRGRLRASRDALEVGVGSRLAADAVAARYEEYIPLYAAGKLVDLGCGKVPLFAAYRDRVTDVVCVDWASSLHGHPHLDREVDLNGPLPFSDGEFDTAMLSDVLEHVTRPEGLFGEVARILSPGGRIFVNVPFLYCVHESPHDYYRYTEFALRRFVEVAGLRLLVIETLGGSAEVMADMLAKHLQLLPVLGKPLARFIQACVATFSRTRLGRRISVDTARAFPLGYFLVAEKPRSPT